MKQRQCVRGEKKNYILSKMLIRFFLFVSQMEVDTKYRQQIKISF